MFHIAGAVCQAYHQEHSRYGPAGIPKASHAKAEPFGQPEDILLLDAQFLAVCAGHCLAAIVTLLKLFDSKFFIALHSIHLLYFLRSFSNSSSHTSEQASLGILQSPLGERATVPTFGPSGRQERLNCWVKNLRQKV